MAPQPRGLTVYKKQEGTLAISKDRKSVSWSPSSPPDTSPTLVITADTITNLQQTPEANPKVMLKIFTQAKGQAEPMAHVFNFISKSSARAEANAIKEALTNSIQAAKAGQNGMPEGAGSSAAMTIANAISGGRTGNVWEDDNRLKADLALQESLMQEDPALRKTFMEARQTRPESISITQFTAQFWSSRVHLLRAHAITKSQNRGSYNVFSTLKREDGGSSMNLSTEHRILIFTQYPLMMRVFDEVVPKKIKSAAEFWSRFFQSRLYITLRGERVVPEQDARDKDLDSYIDAEEITGLRQRMPNIHIPRIIDMEGNEENHSQRKGNQSDLDQRPKGFKDVPIIRTLNDLSEKLMEHVTPSDVDPSQPIGMDEETYNSIRLRDLQADPEQRRIILKIRDQSHFFSDVRGGKADDERAGLSGVDATKAIKRVCADLASAFSQPGAGATNFGLDESNNDDQSGEIAKTTAAPSAAMTHILELVRQHRAQTEEIPASSGLSESVYETLILTQATTTEFLSQFWSAFLSGDSSRVSEITSLVESLNRSMDRIKSVADDAEKDRSALISKTQKQADDIFKRTGKRQRIDYKKIGGGAEVVKRLLGPTTKAVANATARYQKALGEQMAEEG